MSASTRGAARRRLGFSTQTLVLQLAVVLVVIVAMSSVFIWLTYQQLTSQIESRALAVARSVAADLDVRDEVTRISSALTVPSNVELRTGPLQQIGEATRVRTEALFVVITDDDGIRLSHPTPALLGQEVSTSPDTFTSASTEGIEGFTVPLTVVEPPCST